MLYVVDPVQGETNKIRASGDIGFMNTTITNWDWDLVKDIPLHVHHLSPKRENNSNTRNVRVLIQEWVRYKNEFNLSVAHIML